MQTISSSDFHSDPAVTEYSDLRFEKVTFPPAPLVFRNCEFDKCALTYADLISCKVFESKLNNCGLNGSNVWFSKLKACIAENSEVSDSSLYVAHIKNCRTKFSILTHVCLDQGTDAEECTIDFSVFLDAHRSNCRVRNSGPEKPDAKAEDLDRAAEEEMRGINAMLGGMQEVSDEQD